MDDLDDQERAAMRLAMRMMGEVMAEIGWTTPLNGLSEPQVLTLAYVCMKGFQDGMRAGAAAEPEVPF
jgi:hypothetical protein